MLKSKQNDDCMRIAVDDIDQFEHVEGTLKFYVHYQKRANQTITDGASQSLASKVSVGGIGALLRKKITGGGSADPNEDTEDCSELFESKFVKQLIESFNNVLEVMEQQESELNDYVGDDLAQIQQARPASKWRPKEKYKEKKQIPKEQQSTTASPSGSSEQTATAHNPESKAKLVIDNYMDKVKPQDGPKIQKSSSTNPK